MNVPLLGITAGFAAVNWLAVVRRWKRLEYIAKPAVMLALLAWLWSLTRFQGSLAWFALGLVFSLLGDIFLMLSPAWFKAGLVFFLVAHLMYITGFHTDSLPFGITGLILGAGLMAFTAFYYHRLAGALTERGQASMRIPVLFYSAVITLMLLSALLTLFSDAWRALPALLAVLGALLFFISDSLLGWNRFVTPISYGKLAVITTYHLGQIFLIAGAALNFRLP